MLGFLIYFPTLAYIPHYSYLLSLIYLLFKYRNDIPVKYKQITSSRKLNVKVNLLIVVLIILFSLFNRAFFIGNIDTIKDAFPYILLLLLTYIIGVKVSKNDLKVLVFLIFLESLFVIAEYMYGVSTFFSGLERYVEFDYDNPLLYYRRAFGLSENSSIISLKILIAFLLIDFLKFKKSGFLLIKAILAIALIMTFNRTAMLALVLFYVMKTMPFIMKTMRGFLVFRLTYKALFTIIIGFVCVSCLGYLMYDNHELILNQFTRNTKTIELAGREMIWAKYTAFINENLLFGNGSYKYYIDYREGSSHAHNSFLQTLATNGIIIFFLYAFLIIRNISLTNFIFVVAILLYSITQYGIFWGISLMDIILFAFLFNKSINFNSILPSEGRHAIVCEKAT